MNAAVRGCLLAVSGLTLLAQPPERPAPVRFLTADECALCHTRVPSGQHPLWQGSMMAHSATDPIWRAKVEEEVARFPARKAEIEDLCLRCHAPMQSYPLRAAGKTLQLNEVNDHGRDGVSCTVCHQITSEGFGKAESFTGGFVIGNENRIFGPYPNPFSMPMMHHTGFTPTHSAHVSQSELCATCHTVIPHGNFVEQGPYLEWKTSAAARDGRSCQSCHMPDAGEPQYIAHRPPGGPFPPTRARAPVPRHEFIGANYLVPRLMNFPETEARALAQLRRAATVDAKIAGSVLSVTVTNHTGHKLPTAFPSRRLWLRVQLLNAAGAAVQTWGAWDSTALVIRNPLDGSVFETEYEDESGQPTRSLAAAVRYAKDTRISPAGEHSGTVTLRYPVTGASAASYQIDALFQVVRPEYRPATLNITPENFAPVIIATATGKVP